MKSLVVFYSKTGITKKVAENIKEILNCDIEEVVDLKKRSGILGFIISGRDAALEKLTEIKKLTKNISQYEHIIIGTPVWAGNITPAIRTFVESYSRLFKNVSFFCTMRITGDKKVFEKLSLICNKKPIFYISFRQKEVLSGKYLNRLKNLLS